MSIFNNCCLSIQCKLKIYFTFLKKTLNYNMHIIRVILKSLDQYQTFERKVNDILFSIL